MLSDAEIKEIEDQIYTNKLPVGQVLTRILQLLETVKEQRELLRNASEYIEHSPLCRGERPFMKDCDCGLVELQKQIEEKVKS